MDRQMEFLSFTVKVTVILLLWFHPFADTVCSCARLPSYNLLLCWICVLDDEKISGTVTRLTDVSPNCEEACVVRRQYRHFVIFYCMSNAPNNSYR